MLYILHFSVLLFIVMFNEGESNKHTHYERHTLQHKHKHYEKKKKNTTIKFSSFMV